MIAKLPSLPFPNASLPLPAPLACISSTQSPRRFVLCVFRPPALAVRFACSRERERARERERESEGEGDEQSGGERGGKTSHLRSFFSRSHLSLFSSASYSRYAFRHTFRVATILLPSFVSSFPFLRFSSRSRLRFVIFVTVPCVSERKTASNVGRYFSSP